MTLDPSPDKKPALLSRTVWFNILTGAAQLLAIGGNLIPPAAAPFVALASAAINIGLRWITTKPISLTGN